MNLKCDYGMNQGNATLSGGSCGAFQTSSKTASNNWESKIASRSYTSSSKSGSQNCAFFIHSFNRENLQYAVKYKTSLNETLDEITVLIKSKFVDFFIV